MPRPRAAFIVDPADHGVDADCLAFFHQYVLQHAGGGRRNLGVHFIGGNFKERLVALHALAGLLQPFRESSFYDAFAHLGHYDVDHMVLSVTSAGSATSIISNSNCLENSRASAASTSALEAVTAESPHGRHRFGESTRDNVLKIAQIR